MTRISPTIIACLLAGALFCQTALASSPREKDSRYTQKIKASLLQLGTGHATSVTVKLKDNTKLTGYLSEIRESSFVITNLTTSAATTVPYPDVVQVKGNNLSTGAKIAITVAIIAAAAIILYSVKGAFCDGC
jgi:small nuclear ribonucleoprotein (snRNP)-like protein